MLDQLKIRVIHARGQKWVNMKTNTFQIGVKMTLNAPLQARRTDVTCRIHAQMSWTQYRSEKKRESKCKSCKQPNRRHGRRVDLQEQQCFQCMKCFTGLLTCVQKSMGMYRLNNRSCLILQWRNGLSYISEKSKVYKKARFPFFFSFLGFSQFSLTETGLNH